MTRQQRTDARLPQAMSACEFSPCRRYRYTLHREWDFTTSLRLVVIGLNPSTADESKDDPTIRRCIGFAKLWGCGSLTMLNLFAWRDTLPAKMKMQPFPTGDANDRHIREQAKGAHIVLAAWGTHGSHLGRALAVRQILHHNGITLHALHINSDGSPKHPLYVANSAVPKPYPLIS